MKNPGILVAIVAAVILIGLAGTVLEMRNPGKAAFATGKDYADQENYAGAVTQFTTAIRHSPKNALAYLERGRAYYKLGEYAKAISDLGTAEKLRRYIPRLQRKKHLGRLYVIRGAAYLAVGKEAQAKTDFTRGLQFHRKDQWAYNNLAWSLATSTDPKARNGQLAITYATKACELSDWKEPGILDTLAAAYAESGNYAKAIRYQQDAIDLAGEGAGEYTPRLELYRQKQPYREEVSIVDE